MSYHNGYLGVDLDPGPRGLRGQVINFERDDEHKIVLAWSWGWFLRDLVEELERGSFVANAEGELVYVDGWDAWAKAKSGGRRPCGPFTDNSSFSTTARSLSVAGGARRLARCGA